MGNVCPTRRPGAVSESEPLLAYLRKYHRAPESQHLDAAGALQSFLACAKKDGYISADDHEELAKALQDIKAALPAGGATKKRKEIVLKKAETCSLSKPILPGLGFSNKSDFAGPKKRGSRDEYPTIARILESGEDANAILHDIHFDCHTRSSKIEIDSAIIAYGFSNAAEGTNYLGRYQMSPDKFTTWLKAIASQYSKVPYHNWNHAFDVFQLSFVALTDGGLHKYLNNQDAMTILFAAIAHDVGHEGTNNAFQIKAQTPLAITYNDKSPLENMHASLTFQSLNKPGADVFDRMPHEDFLIVRAKIVDLILETDPAHHFEYAEKLSARMSRGPITAQKELKSWKANSNFKELEASNKEDRRLLLQGIVHMWDIGNGVRPWDCYKCMVASLEQEFFLQGDRERELGLQIAPLMDRTKDTLAGGQGFFLGQLVLPLFNLYSKFMVDDVTAKFHANLDSNMKRWQALVNKHGSKSANEILRLENEEGSSAQDVSDQHD